MAKKTKSYAIPIAILISDDHVSLKNQEPSIQALEMAVSIANDMGLPLISGGDLHDTKSIHRDECIRAMRKALKAAEIKPILLIGNHERQNEKSPDHAMSCVEDLVSIVNDQTAHYRQDLNLWFIPYCHDSDVFLKALSFIPDDVILICHQGVRGARMGEYIVDRSQVDPSVFDRFRAVWSGHYHEHQTLGKFNYIGSPYTITFAEANDGPKGLRVLMSDGSTQLIELEEIRRHVILEVQASEVSQIPRIDPKTLLRLKISGSKEQLSAFKKADLGQQILGHANFKLERDPTDAPELKQDKISKNETFEQIMARMLSEGTPAAKALWKELHASASS